ncbi:MAG TPA: uroporphyrinogen-III synthase [Flavobacterium sp.]|jgi:uroporphyrinogen-III synthase
MHEQPQIVSTKKLLPNQKQFLLNAGLSVIEADFIKVQYKDVLISTDADYVIFTSSNAVKAILKSADFPKLQQMPCFCVGEKTKNLLGQNGFDVLASADNAEVLVDKFKAHSDKKFLLLSGNLRLETIPRALQEANINYEEVEVYSTTKTPIKIKSKPNGILFFSPSAVESYLELNKINNAICFCIGNTTAKAVNGLTENIVVANQPSVENVIVQSIKHFKQASPFVSDTKQT